MIHLNHLNDQHHHLVLIFSSFDNDVACTFVIVSMQSSWTVSVSDTLLNFLSNNIIFVDFFIILLLLYSILPLDTKCVSSYYHFQFSCHCLPYFFSILFFVMLPYYPNHVLLVFIAFNGRIYLC